MRGLRSTIALAVVLGGLAAYIYFVTWKRPATDESAKEKVFASIQADTISEVHVTSGSGETTTLQKTDAGWQITSPTAARADDAEVSGITANLASLEIERVIDDNPSDLKDFGLDQPLVEIGFKVTDSPDDRLLLIGGKSPTGNGLFAKRDTDKRVFLIRASLESTFNRSSFDLRNKTLLAFDREKVDRIDLIADGKTIQISKDGGEWKIARPLQVRADFGAVEGVLGRLQTAQMKSIVTADASPADLKKYGLDTPNITATLSLGSARATLLLGGKAEDTTVYARDASRPVVMTVEGILADDLKKDLDTYRRKDVFEFRAYNATHVEITRDGQTAVFDKVKGAGEKGADTWRRVSPDSGDVPRETMDTLLGELSNLRIESFVDSTVNTGLNQPVATVVVKFDDGKKEERATFGRVAKDVFVARSSEPGAGRISETSFTDAMKALDGVLK
jgi:hypothetical protein